MFRTLLLFVLATFLLFSCANNGKDASLDTEGPVTNVLDTIPPPADEADGMDNRPGYHTTQMSTEVDKDIPIPDGNLNIPPQGMIFMPERSEIDYSPNRYTFRYLLEEIEGEVAESPVKKERPPLFSSACIGSERVLECSNEALLGYLRRLPAASEEGRLLYAVVTLGSDGQPENIERIQCTGTFPCIAYQNQAWAALLNMPAWEPAMYEGRAVKSQVVIPIRIELQEGEAG
ncbi:MAG: hypothetical protein J5I94_08445 [Phaeodactylibacter sp.]|nr:hypothetical protein [Phaeodactylibacter sp.]